MSLISLLILLVVIGVVLWAIITYIPMPQAIKSIILVVGIIVALYYVLSAFGILGHLQSVQVPTVR